MTLQVGDRALQQTTHPLAIERLVGIADPCIDLVRITGVVADCSSDPACVDGEDLGSGVEGTLAGLVNLTEKLDDLPNVRAVVERCASAGRAVLEITPGRQPAAAENKSKRW